MKKKNLLITGRPGVGKTTVVRTVAARIKKQAIGFFTEEMREGNHRIGFSVQTLDGRKGLLAHKKMDTPYKVGAYSVLLRDFELVAVEPLFQNLSLADVVIIDEIGKMELLSTRFQEFLFTILDFPIPLIASIMEKQHPIANKIKARDDVEIFAVTLNNRHLLADEILSRLQTIERLRR